MTLLALALIFAAADDGALCERAKALPIDAGRPSTPAKRADGLSTERLDAFVKRCFQQGAPAAKYALTARTSAGLVEGGLYERASGAIPFRTPRDTAPPPKMDQASLDAAIDRFLSSLITAAEAHVAKEAEREAALQKQRAALAKAGVVVSVAEPKSAALEAALLQRLKLAGVVVHAATAADAKKVAQDLGLQYLLSVDATAKMTSEGAVGMNVHTLAVKAKLLRVDGAVLIEEQASRGVLSINPDSAVKSNLASVDVNDTKPAWVVADAIAAALLADLAKR